MTRPSRLTTIALALALVALVAHDVHLPDEIPWQRSVLNGHDIMEAHGVVVQHQIGEEVWGTVGYSIYVSREGGPFRRVAEVQPRLGLAWAGYSSTLRSLTRHFELAEVLPLTPQTLIAFAGGDIYRVDVQSGAQERVHTLRYFGLREGRGVMPHGIALDAEGSIYYGEYTTLPSHGQDHEVRLYRSQDEGRTWQTAYRFEAGEVRHIHMVRWDDHGGVLWMGTGDPKPQPHLGYSSDSGNTFDWIGDRTEQFRVVSMLFFERSVVWAADTNRTEYMNSAAYSRTTSDIRVGTQPLPAPAYYALQIENNEGIIGLAEPEVSLWSLSSESTLHKLYEWPIKDDTRGPNPVLRLPRGSAVDARWVYVSPLRTAETASATLRIPKAFFVQQRSSGKQASNEASEIRRELYP